MGIWDNAQAAKNAEAQTSGVNTDGSMYVPGQEQPSPYIDTHGTGELGAPNPNYIVGGLPGVSLIEPRPGSGEIDAGTGGLSPELQQQIQDRLAGIGTVY